MAGDLHDEHVTYSATYLGLGLGLELGLGLGLGLGLAVDIVRRDVEESEEVRSIRVRVTGGVG